MTGLMAFHEYHGIKLHFTTKHYDYVQRKGGVRGASLISWRKNRHDKWFWQELSRKSEREVQQYCIAQFVNLGRDSTNTILQGMYCEDGDKQKYHDHIYRLWRKRKEAGQYSFQEDINALFDRELHSKLFRGTSSDYPELLVDFVNQKVTIETMVILNKIIQFLPRWIEQYRGREIPSTGKTRLMGKCWEVFQRLEKYESFFHGVSLKSYKRTLKDVTYK